MCQINYDIIGKMESFSMDSKYIMDKTGMNSTKVKLEEKNNVSSGTGESTEELTKKMFAKISNELIEKLFELYKFDFEMFDYEYRDFLS